MKRFGFTLAEVLITLGIIGIVAAMTMPTLYSACSKKIIETRLQMTNAIILQAFKKYQTETQTIPLTKYEEVDVNGYSWQKSKDFFDEYFARTLKTTYTYPKGIRFPIYGHNDADFTNVYNHYYVFSQLSNGTVIGVSKNGNYDGIRVLVILKPQKKKIHIGREVFELQYMPDDFSGYYAYNPALKRNYTDNRRQEYIDACISEKAHPLFSMSAAEFCGFLILQNNFKVPKDYPIKL